MQDLSLKCKAKELTRDIEILTDLKAEISLSDRYFKHLIKRLTFRKNYHPGRK